MDSDYQSIFVVLVTVVAGSQPLPAPPRPGFDYHNMHNVSTTFGTLFGVRTALWVEEEVSFGVKIPIFWYFSLLFDLFLGHIVESDNWNFFTQCPMKMNIWGKILWSADSHV